MDTANSIKEKLAQADKEYANSIFVATGYGRVSVPYADKTVSEITCHSKGAVYLFNARDCTVIDIGGQDTKIIFIAEGKTVDFIMNDKCSVRSMVDESAADIVGAIANRYLNIGCSVMTPNLKRMEMIPELLQ